MGVGVGKRGVGVPTDNRTPDIDVGNGLDEEVVFEVVFEVVLEVVPKAVAERATPPNPLIKVVVICFLIFLGGVKSACGREIPAFSLTSDFTSHLCEPCPRACFSLSAMSIIRRRIWANIRRKDNDNHKMKINNF